MVVVALLAFCCLVLSVPNRAQGSWAASGPYALIAWFGAQVAVVAGVLALARSLRYRAEGGAVPSDRLADIYRPNAVALACAGALVVALAIGAGAHSGSLHGGGHRGCGRDGRAGTAGGGRRGPAWRGRSRGRGRSRPPREGTQAAICLRSRCSSLTCSSGARHGWPPGSEARVLASKSRRRACVRRAPRLARWLDLQGPPVALLRSVRGGVRSGRRARPRPERWRPGQPDRRQCGALAPRRGRAWRRSKARSSQSRFSRSAASSGIRREPV